MADGHGPLRQSQAQARHALQAASPAEQERALAALVASNESLARLGEDAQSPEWAAQVRAELHESMNTIHRCIEANLAMKQKALARLDPPDTKMRKFRAPDALMRFLQSL